METELALGVLQLVALSLPAFAILLELMVESNFPYANRAVPVVAGSFAALVAGGIVIVSGILLQPHTFLMRASLLLIDVGLVGMVAGIALIAHRTRREQRRAAD